MRSFAPSAWAACAGLLLGACAPLTTTPPPPSGPVSAAHAGAAAVLPLPRAAAPTTIEVGIAAFNDFHGHLLSSGISVKTTAPDGTALSIPAGGAARLASVIDAIRARHPNHLTLSAGDLIGASPLDSALFLDEPTIGVMNRIGLDISTLGNHEFDHGRAELLRIGHGGCAKLTSRTPCALEPYTGPAFTLLAANTLTQSGAPLFAPSALRRFGTGKRAVTIGIIGETLKGTGALSPPDATAGLTWADEADTANAEAAKLKAAGADTVILLIHQGSRTDNTHPDPNGCDGLTGAPDADIRPILDRLAPTIDVVISGHTHWAYVCDYVASKHHILLTSAGLYGEMATEITLSIDPAHHRLTGAQAHNIIAALPGSPYPTAPERADIAAYVQRYADAARQLSERLVGHLSAPLAKAADGAGGPLGQFLADAQLAATRAAGAQIALMNPFGIRASLVPDAKGQVTYGRAYAVQPFNNNLVTQSFTGAQIRAILEQGLDDNGPEQPLSPSSSFAYGIDHQAPSGHRITSITLDGQPIDPAATYRVTTNHFLAAGGDSFTLLAQGKDRKASTTTDLDALVDWLGTQAR